jgi:hypothetical protein
MKFYISLAAALLFVYLGSAQELYPYSEPASNMPARSIAVRTMAVVGTNGNNNLQRYMQDIMFGINKNLMIHAGANFSNMQTLSVNWEGARVYAKYRFLSRDDVHKHFRMAAYGLYSYSRNNLKYNDINLMMGEQTGLQTGVIATQLWNKLAVSGTVGWNEVFDGLRRNKQYRNLYAFRSVNYSLSAGYLLFPVEYKNYDQTNINLYAELLGGRNINFPAESHWIDLAPSVQAIFSSTAKLNIGYRFQLKSDIYRMTKNSVMVSFEYIFLNALKRRS